MVNVKNYSELLDALREMAAEQFCLEPVEGISFDADMRGDLEVDSLDIVEFLINLETEFDIKIPQVKAQNIKSIRDAADYISEALNIPSE